MRSNGRADTTRAPAKYAGLGGGHSDPAVQFGEADAELVRNCIEAIITDGDAVMFGQTSDGGALSVSVYSGGARQQFYCTNLDQIQNLLVELRRAASNG